MGSAPAWRSLTADTDSPFLDPPSCPVEVGERSVDLPSPFTRPWPDLPATELGWSLVDGPAPALRPDHPDGAAGA